MVLTPIMSPLHIHLYFSERSNFMNAVIGFVCGVVGFALAVVMFIVGVLAGFSLASADI